MVLRPYLELIRLSKRYAGHAAAVSDLSLAIGQGEMVALLGVSGCGKTTTLRMIAGLVEPSAGSIVIGGTDVTALPAHRRRIGVVFQSYALFPHLSVFENVAFGLRMRGIGSAAMREKVRQALALVHLEPMTERRPRELSGGQQQRVALARALVIEPTLLLLDEPLSNLDAKLREAMRDEIRRIQQSLGITAIFVTHDQTEALTISDRIAVMHNGSIAQFGTPRDIYRHPASSMVAKFVGRMNVLPAGDGGGRELLIRPHDIALDESGAGGPHRTIGCVERVVYAGDVTECHVRVRETLIVVELNESLHMTPPTVGASVRLSWQNENVHSFDQ